jgi:hypothetical protein
MQLQRGARDTITITVSSYITKLKSKSVQDGIEIKTCWPPLLFLVRKDYQKLKSKSILAAAGMGILH